MRKQHKSCLFKEVSLLKFLPHFIFKQPPRKKVVVI